MSRSAMRLIEKGLSFSLLQSDYYNQVMENPRHRDQFQMFFPRKRYRCRIMVIGHIVTQVTLITLQKFAMIFT